MKASVNQIPQKFRRRIRTHASEDRTEVGGIVTSDGSMSDDGPHISTNNSRNRVELPVVLVRSQSCHIDVASVRLTSEIEQLLEEHGVRRAVRAHIPRAGEITAGDGRVTLGFQVAAT